MFFLSLLIHLLEAVWSSQGPVSVNLPELFFLSVEFLGNSVGMSKVCNALAVSFFIFSV